MSASGPMRMGIRFFHSRAVVQRLLFAPVSCGVAIVDHRFYGTDKYDSVLGPPKVRNPFDHPSRVDASSRKTSVSQFSGQKQSPPPPPPSTGDSKKTDSGEQKEKPVEKDEASLADLRERTFIAEPEALSAAAGATAQASDSSFASEATKKAAEQSTWQRFIKRTGYVIEDDMSDDEKRRIKMARNTFLGSVFVFGGLAVGLVWFCFHYGKAPRDDAGNVLTDEFTGTSFAWVHRIMNSFKLWRDYVVEPSRELLLPDPLPYPYHQPKYTLVIEMKNILVAPEWTYKTGYRFKKRPALDYFLDVVGYPNFEVVIYTSESSMSAPSVIDSMDPKQRIMYKLYRDCTKYMNGHHVKDLSKLNRDLKKVIYIDFDPKSFQLNPENVLRMPKWDGDMSDTALIDLAELLKTIYLSDAEDVRPTLQYYSQFDDPAKEFRNRAQILAEQEVQQSRYQDDNSTLKRYTGRLFGFRRHQA